MPGDVSTIPEPRTARLVAHQLSVTAPGRDRLGDADQAVGDLVVRLGVDDPAQRVAAALPEDAGDDRVDVACRVVMRLELGPDAADEPGVPLGREPGAAFVGRRHEDRVVLEVLGDRDLPRLARLDLVVDPGEERPAVGKGSGAGSFG